MELWALVVERLAHLANSFLALNIKNFSGQQSSQDYFLPVQRALKFSAVFGTLSAKSYRKQTTIMRFTNPKECADLYLEGYSACWFLADGNIKENLRIFQKLCHVCAEDRSSTARSTELWQWCGGLPSVNFPKHHQVAKKKYLLVWVLYSYFYFCISHFIDHHSDSRCIVLARVLLPLKHLLKFLSNVLQFIEFRSSLVRSLNTMRR